MKYFVFLEHLNIKIMLAKVQLSSFKAQQKADRFYQLSAYQEAAELRRSDYDLMKAFFDSKITSDRVCLTSIEIRHLMQNLSLPATCRDLEKLIQKHGTTQLLN